MKHKIIMIVFIIFLTIGAVFAYQLLKPEKIISVKKEIIETKTPLINPPISKDCSIVKDTYLKPDFSGIKSSLEKEALVSEFPKAGSLRLRFFHFTEGCRFWDKSFILKTNSVEEGDFQTDIDIWVHSKYAPDLKTQGLCDVVQNAKSNGDFGQSTNLGKTRLTIRYASLLKYKDCFGL